MTQPNQNYLEQRGSGTEVALLDIPGAASHLSVSERFVRRLVLERRVTYHKVGRFVRFDPADLDDFLTDCRVEQVRYNR